MIDCLWRDRGELKQGGPAEARARSLMESGEAADVRDRHLRWCAQFVEEARPRLVGRTQSVWMARLAHEHDNVRAALRWALERDEIDTALRIGGAVWRFWWLRGSFHEGRTWLNEILERSTDSADPVARARLGCPTP